MRTRILILGLASVLLCGAKPEKEHPLNLVLPSPDEAVRLAWFKATPDETVLDKVKNLEQATRQANPEAKEWSIYLTPAAASISIKGWQADMNRPDTPRPEGTLAECLQSLANRAGLRYDVLNGKVLIDVAKKEALHNKVPEDTARKLADPQH